ncbi:LuxR C-terminal-related transcriptional regulator [Modestobacter sp. L9-4]|nr:LuxR C-terminal-related transcriptional regulator [Modestobacter sp. L9-4]
MTASESWLAWDGLSNQGIVERLFVNQLTIRTYIHRATMKLGARNSSSPVAIAHRKGLVRAF